MIVKKVQHTVENPKKYRADVVHYVDIDDLENIQPDNTRYDIEEIVQTQMQNYCSIMFDIENFVFIPSKTNHETYNKVPENRLKFCD